MQDISTTEFLELLKKENHNCILLDVREEIEFHTFNVGGKNLPLGQIQLAIENEELDVDELADKVKRVSSLLKICKDKLLKTNEQVEQILKEMEE